MVQYTEWRSISDGSIISSIPDSVVERPADNSTVSDDDRLAGLPIETKTKWTSIGVTISQNTTGLTRAYLEDEDGNELDAVDISDLSSGDVFTFEDVNLQSDEIYLILGDAEGSTYDSGQNDGSEGDYPFTSDDVDIIGAVTDNNRQIETDQQARLFNSIGNVGFD